ncbi:MAG: lysozyme [Lachnospiraceae bacterium]|nr:lysozyme [Lachnospiraceae bacterium]
MQIKVKLIIVILALCMLVSACASSSSAEPEASSLETEGMTTTETGTVEETSPATTTETTTEEETTSEEVTEEGTTYDHLGITDGMLKYEDVRGYFFRTKFHEDWPQNDYDQTAFAMVDGRMTYADDRYTYRLGVDVYDAYSHIDWDAVKADGYDFAIMRLGYRGYAYPSFERDGMVINNLLGALRAGLDVGVYFFSQAINEEEAVEEAEYVIKILQGDLYTPEFIKMGVAYDPEYIGSRSARSTDLTGEQITKNARAFCDRIREAGYKALIYSNMVWEDRNLDLSQLSDIDIWYADYTAYPQSPYQFAIWQYGHGEAAGVEGAVDVNIELIPVPEEPETEAETAADAS